MKQHGIPFGRFRNPAIEVHSSHKHMKMYHDMTAQIRKKKVWNIASLFETQLFNSDVLQNQGIFKNQHHIKHEEKTEHKTIPYTCFNRQFSQTRHEIFIHVALPPS